VRNRPQTIGTLGRTPARHGSQPSIPPPPQPGDPDAPERGRIRRWLHGALFDNLGLKFLSLVLAATVFLLVTSDEHHEISVAVGVKYEYPSDKVLVSDPLEVVRVTIKGPLRRLRDFDEQSRRVVLDLRNAPTGEIAITPDMITNLPPKLEVTSINPRSVRVVFDRRIEKLIEITPVVSGQPQHGYEVDQISVVPPTIPVRGAERVLAAATSIRTSEVTLDGKAESFDQLAEIVAPAGVIVDPQQRIGVRVRLRVKLVTQTLEDVPVVVEGEGIDPARWRPSPETVDVTLTGPLLDVEAARSRMTAKAILAPGDARVREAKVTLEGLKQGLGAKVSPEQIKVIPIKP
jgi:YbbR domain-containing protein